jgi:hypothetical protein
MLMNAADQFPQVLDPSRVGTYEALAKSGGGYVWDAVLEYRVWCHPERGAIDSEEGNDYYYAFATYAEALAFAEETRGAELHSLSCSKRNTSTSRPRDDMFTSARAGSPSGGLSSSPPRRTPRTIPDFLASNGPNRLETLDG